ncbi:MAG: YdiU family protein [Zoogloeaceae bacterium]|nr:YdiU family protein [Zoogloeaceae bacterium]
MSSPSRTGWNFDNTYAGLPERLYVRQNAARHAAPSLVILNHALAQRLGLDADVLERGEAADVFSGNVMPAGAQPLAQAYAGHQFGFFNMLGDGRALLLGEQIAPDGARFDIQLKGSGVTPFSRRGDGKAALGPMLREYLVSEAMHALGIPTTRSLAVVKTGEPVYRDTALPGAVLTRVAASHLRVGTFEYAYGIGAPPVLKALADYAIRRHDAALADTQNPYLGLLHAVAERQARLVAQWMHAGFIHGVMNTDNMTISGETIDYGPCAFMDAYHPDTVFSSIDNRGRYAYGNQPAIAQWNLARFAEALLPLIADDQETAVQLAASAIQAFSGVYEQAWLEGMRRKLGLLDAQPDDKALADDLLAAMQNHGLDFTLTFRALTERQTVDYAAPDMQAWQTRWKMRRDGQPASREQALAAMRQANPAVIPRNYLVEAALDAAVNDGDMEPFKRLHAALARPFEATPENARYRAAPPPAQQAYRTYCGT